VNDLIFVKPKNILKPQNKSIIMHKLNIFEQISTSEFGLHFGKLVEVGDIMVAGEEHIDNLLHGVYGNRKNQSREKRSLEEAKKKLEAKKKKLPRYEVLLESDKVAEEEKREINAEFFKIEQEIERLEKRLQDRNKSDLILDRFDSYAHNDYAQALDAWLIALGEWVATGALGPGEVKYRDRVFKAE
jgi:hypothetical protein